MVDVNSALDEAGLTNPRVREYVAHWAAHHPARPGRGRQRRRRRAAGAGGARRRRAAARRRGALLLAQLLQGHRPLRGAHGRRDQQRGRQGRLQQLEARGRDEAELLTERMRGASAGKTMYVIPYLMAPPGSPLEAYAAGVELTDSRPVVLHMIRMSRVGASYVNNLEDPDSFVRAVHVTGDLENLGQGTPEDQRYFVDRRRRADDPALRLVVRRQRAARQDRPRPAPGLLRRPRVGRLPRRAVHAARHHRQGDRASAGTSAAASRAPRARPTSR